MRSQRLINCLVVSLWVFAIPCLAVAEASDEARAGQADAAKAAVVDSKYANPVDAAREINSALRQLCLDILSDEVGAPIRPEHVRRLDKQLTLLSEVDLYLRRLGAGLADEGLRGVRADVLHDRAVAWLNAWWAFGELTQRISLGGHPADQRRRLMGTDEKSALGLLLKTYTQICEGEADQRERINRLLDKRSHPGLEEAEWERKKGEMKAWLISGSTQEPLRLRLGDSVWLDRMLGCPDDFRPPAPAARAVHEFHIPSAADLVGSPDDRPTRTDPDNHRRLMTLWSLVNLQLDAWPNAHPPGDGLKSLSEWLEELAGQDALQAFDSQSAVGTRLKQRARKLSQFCAFRVRAATELGDIVRQLGEDRNGPNKGPDTIIGDLIAAATPLDDGEYLADAAIWLRYVIFLSYQGEGGLILVGDGSNSLDTYWRHHELPHNFLLPPTASRGETTIRWQGWPAEGHCASMISDLVTTAYLYLRFQKAVVGLEEQRFTNPEYAQELSAKLDAFRTKLPKSAVFALEPAPLHELSSSHVIENLTERRRAAMKNNKLWKYTATAHEQERLLRDSAAVSDRVQMAISHNELVISIAKTAAAGRVNEIGSALAGLGGLSELADCNLNVPPTASFDDYANRLEKLAQELREMAQVSNVKDGDAAKELVFEYHTRHQESIVADLQLEARHFALQAAEDALEMSLIYRTVAHLNIEIHRLNELAASAKLEGFNSTNEVAGIRLVLATRQRDLAAAQLQALEAALRHAEVKLIPEAVNNLNQLQAKLKDRARAIQEEENKAFIVGLIKAAVRVVGLALSPFTGGTSAVIANAAVMAYDAADAANKADWSNLGEAIDNVGNLVRVAERIGADVINVVGDEGLKQGFAELQKSLAERVEVFGDAANQLLDQIPDLREIQNTISAAAAGWPVKYADEKLALLIPDLGEQHVARLEGDFKTRVQAILDTGGFFVNDLNNRVNRLGILPALPDERLKEELKHAINEIVRQAPDSVQRKIKEMAGIAGNFDAAKDDLRKWVEEAEPKEIRAFTALLGSGVIFVRDAEGVYAIQRPVKGELNGMKERVEAVKKAVLDKEFQGLVRKIIEKNRELEDAIARAGNDASAIYRIADGDIPRWCIAIGGTLDPATRENEGGLLQDLKNKIADIKGEIEDKQLTVDASALEKQSAEYFAYAAGLDLQGAAKKIDKALNYTRMSEVQIAREEANLSEKQSDVARAEQSVDLARRRARWAYYRCIDRGIDPNGEAWKGVAAGYFRKRDGESILGAMLRTANAGEVKQRHLVRRMAAEYVGMLRWLYVLGINDPRALEWEEKDAIGWYLRLLSDLSSDKSAAEVENQLTENAATLRRQIQTVAAFNFDVHAIARDEAYEIRYFESIDSAKADEWLSSQQEPDYQQTAIARLDVLVAKRRCDGEPDIGPSFVPFQHERELIAMANLTTIEYARAIVPTPPLTYVVIPPPNGRITAEGTVIPIVSPPGATEERNIAPDVAAAEALKGAGQKHIGLFPTDPGIVGAYGMWRVYVFDTNINQMNRADRIAKYRQELHFKIWLVCLIPGATVSQRVLEVNRKDNRDPGLRVAYDTFVLLESEETDGGQLVTLGTLVRDENGKLAIGGSDGQLVRIKLLLPKGLEAAHLKKQLSQSLPNIAAALLRRDEKDFMTEEVLAIKVVEDNELVIKFLNAGDAAPNP